MEAALGVPAYILVGMQTDYRIQSEETVDRKKNRL
jgi:hypothetical protein